LRQRPRRLPQLFAGETNDQANNENFCLNVPADSIQTTMRFAAGRIDCTPLILPPFRR